MGIFDGIVFCLIGIDGKERSDLVNHVCNNGGKVSYLVTDQVKYVITTEAQVLPQPSFSVSLAIKKSLCLVRTNFVLESLLSGSLLSHAPFVLGGSQTGDSSSHVLLDSTKELSPSIVITQQLSPNDGSTPNDLNVSNHESNAAGLQTSENNHGHEPEPEDFFDITTITCGDAHPSATPGHILLHQMRLIKSKRELFTPTVLDESFFAPGPHDSSYSPMGNIIGLENNPSTSLPGQKTFNLMSIAAVPSNQGFALEELRFMHYLWMQGKSYDVVKIKDKKAESDADNKDQNRLYDTDVIYQPYYSENDADVNDLKEQAIEPTKEMGLSQLEVNYIETKHFHLEMSMLWSVGRGFQTGSGLGPSAHVNYQNCKAMQSGEQKILKNVSVFSTGRTHSALVTKEGSLYTCGLGKGGRLGHDNTSNTSYFLRVGHSLMDKIVLTVSCGGAHTVALCYGGQAYSFGKNSSGQLGLGDLEPRYSPQLVKTTAGLSLSAVACGSNFTLALDSSGQAWGWGNNEYGQSGKLKRGNKIITAPVCFTALAKDRFVALACGEEHALLLSMKGRVYSKGNNIYGQLGIGSQKISNPVTRVEFPDDEVIVQVSCGAQHSAALTKDGNMYAWGRGDKWQLEKTSNQDYNTPTSTFALKEKITHISCGADMTAVVTESGKLHIFGQAYTEVAGKTPSSALTYFQKENMAKISSVVVGPDHLIMSIAVPEEQAVQLARGGDTLEMEDLIHNGVDPNYRSEDGFGLIHHAVMYKHTNTIAGLLRAGADGHLPVARSRFYNDDIIRLLAKRSHKGGSSKKSSKKPSKKGKSTDQDAPAQDAALPTPITGATALHLAVGIAHMESIELLVCSCDVDRQDELGLTPLHWAVIYNHLDVAEYLIEKGVRKNIQSADGRTALHYAVQDESWRIARLLVQKAADITVSDQQGKTALDYCAFNVSAELKRLGNKHEVFISYAHADAVIAKKIKEMVETKSVPCWMDAFKLEAGTDWRSDIGMAITSSRMLLFVQSDASNASESCQKELSIAFRNGIPICCAQISEVTKTKPHPVVLKRKTFHFEKFGFDSCVRDLAAYVHTRVVHMRKFAYISPLHYKISADSLGAGEGQNYFAIVKPNENVAPPMRVIQSALTLCSTPSVQVSYSELINPASTKTASEQDEEDELPENQSVSPFTVLTKAQLVIFMLSNQILKAHSSQIVEFLKQVCKERPVIVALTEKVEPSLAKPLLNVLSNPSINSRVVEICPENEKLLLNHIDSLLQTCTQEQLISQLETQLEQQTHHQQKIHVELFKMRQYFFTEDRVVFEFTN